MERKKFIRPTLANPDMVFQPHDRPILVFGLSGVSKQKTFSNLKLGGIEVGELTPT